MPIQILEINISAKYERLGNVLFGFIWLIFGWKRINLCIYIYFVYYI